MTSRRPMVLRRGDVSGSAVEPPLELVQRDRQITRGAFHAVVRLRVQRARIGERIVDAAIRVGKPVVAKRDAVTRELRP